MSKSNLYCDGGTIGKNPSPHGGAWAWCYVDTATHTIRNNASGIITVFYRDNTGDTPFMKGITNNVTEFYAMLHGLESLPQGWEGDVCSDSILTLARFFKIPERNINRKWPLKNIPKAWEERMHCALSRLGNNIHPILLSGHPTREHLLSGIGARGTPVSIHNVWCDEECGRLIKKFKEENKL